MLRQKQGTDCEEDEAREEVERPVECHRAKRGAALYGLSSREQENLEGLPAELRPGREKAHAKTGKAVERETSKRDDGT
jgi:hypothetical protein